MHLLLLATLASAGPDTGTADHECGYGVDVEGTWTGTGCLVNNLPDVCPRVWEEPGCPTWDQMLALDDWALATCANGGSTASGPGLPGASTELYFDTAGALVAAEVQGDWSHWTPICCDGTETRTIQYGALYECASPVPLDDSDEVPAEIADSGATPLPADLPEPDTSSGCGCDQAATASVWWLVALVAIRRRVAP